MVRKIQVLEFKAPVDPAAFSEGYAKLVAYTDKEGAPKDHFVSGIFRITKVDQEQGKIICADTNNRFPICMSRVEIYKPLRKIT